jgi:hypothetical protein
MNPSALFLTTTDSSYKTDLLIYQLYNMAPLNIVLILISLFLAPTILIFTTLLLVDDSAFFAAMRQQLQHYLSEQRGVCETPGRWDRVWTHMEVAPSMEQRPFLPQLPPLPSAPRKVIRRRAVDFTLGDSPPGTPEPFFFASLSLSTRRPNSGPLQPIVLTKDSTWDYALSMEDVTLGFMTTAQRDLEAALLATAEEQRKARDKERMETKKNVKKGGKVNPSLWSIEH